ncbi:DHS-like NAD/FAD-binding domain-containing protein [Syncephalastrum racemosum]|uniref:DHS-like NAD/FAD-binding domain-containing protein n=1 Tax=Syncephalastrum racemosum TaxID=13706 RepID=A0A1X2HTB6_SYNRA|nr:DHS-like NAD/FAD-binding domain-containing protein [Syncephalastrum racemosum]
MLNEPNSDQKGHSPNDFVSVISDPQDQGDLDSRDAKRLKLDDVPSTSSTIDPTALCNPPPNQQQSTNEQIHSQPDSVLTTPSVQDSNPALENDDSGDSDRDWQHPADSDDSSDTSSHYGLVPGALTAGSQEEYEEPPWGTFSDEECLAIQEDARQLGLMKFIKKYILEEKVPVLKLMQAFDITLHPGAAIVLSDAQLIPLLQNVVTRFLRRRRRLQHVNTLEDVVQLLSKANNVMIVTGAGVSVSCGIPDFRSETGIYSRLEEYCLDDPQQMFDIRYFRETPEIFYSFAKELYPSNYQPSPSHMFVKLIEEKGKLLRNYTQNIDTLEHKANIKRIVNCHGSFATASCVTCGYKCDGKEIEKYIFAQQVPKCPRCYVEPPKKNTKESDDEDDGRPDLRRGQSVIKPDITFFGESLPAEFDRLLSVDSDVVDLLIVMGSSLKVSPVSEIMSQVPHSVPQILINRTPITHMTFDVQLLGDCDVIVPELCRLLNWDLKHEKLPGGSALSPESMRSRQDAMGKFEHGGLYTFPGAVVSEQYLSRYKGENTTDEAGSLPDDPEDDSGKEEDTIQQQPEKDSEPLHGY